MAKINNSLEHKISDEDIEKLSKLNMNQFLEFLWRIEHAENATSVELTG